MRYLLVTLIAGLVVVPAGTAHTTKASWTAYDAEKRLTIGRFAAANGIKYADCLGTGSSTGTPGRLTQKFKHLECTVQDKEFGNERQLVVHVRSATSFTAEWLSVRPACG